MTESSAGRLQEYFSRRMSIPAFQIADTVARRASEDNIFGSALEIFKVVKWKEIEAISYESMLMDDALMPDSLRGIIEEKRRRARAEFARVSEGAQRMMVLLHPDAQGYLQVIESSFNEAYEAGSVGMSDMSEKVELMGDLVAAFGIQTYTKKIIIDNHTKF